ncbi:globin-like protein [Xylaria bambusicola]|uniref:globin-like protein n=1 Tax=Xylaria bambusicola TaxID=326684 RepID=UPI0020073AD6|nr:globin-like protein [Xylaria bambusicola]KAI0515154.1 globin-like protein [Xylaria bambusicola]
MAAPLTPEQIAVVKATAPVLKEHGVTITSLFYKNMLDANPELRNVFNEANQVGGAQPRALAAAVFAYATYVDDLGKLAAAVERIAHKHASLNVQPEHYPIVGKFLLEAVASVLGDACTPEIAEAWTAAYAVLADIFINREQQIYVAFENWSGWRRFKIQKKVPESSEITSFYLAPEDGVALPRYLPGQYISLQLYIPKLGVRQPRQYSLSDAPGSDCYRISVKKEAGGKSATVPGLISNMLHDDFNEGDVVELTHPTGEFFVRVEEETPLVLISAGVGITPMASILNSVASTGSSRRVSLVHGAHGSEVRAFSAALRTAAEKPNVQTSMFLSTLKPNEVQGVDYDFEGRVDLDKVGSERLFLDDAVANYYVCGPTSFMVDIQKYLVDHGVNEDRIHLEIFGVGN